MMLQIRLLGQFSLVYKGEQVTTINADRLQSLLVYLLMHRQGPRPRQQIAFQLWPDSNEAQARSNLRNLLFSLRQALPDAEHFLEITNTTLQWRPDGPYTLDVEDFQRLFQQADEAEQIEAETEARQALEQAVDLYAGELLPGNYDDWILPLREELHQLYQETLERLISVCEEGEDYRAALRYAQRLLQHDPLDEGVYIYLMRFHALCGDRAGVRRVYETCTNTLLRELDVEPSGTTRAAYDRYLRMAVPHDPVAEPVPAPAPAMVLADPASIAPRPAPKRAASLPMPALTFVGRERELAQLAQLLADPNCRLLTILGPGGIGKTHLALQTAKGHQPVFADGAVFIPLATIADVDEMLLAITNGLNLSAQASTQPQTQLLNYLQEKEMLLVLDNFEHLLVGIDLVVDVLAAAPNVKILVTSRERLNLQEEWVYSLQGLPVPGEEDPNWQENSSVVLFLNVARKVRNDFALTEADRPAMIQLCRLLDGMPLAIQLAASWVRVLSPAEIVREIQEDLEFLTISHRNMPERHRSLRAVFDHSWQLLSSEEQHVLSRLAVFRGSFSREAAEAVVGANLRLLTSLLDKSLVRQSGTGRYSLHDLLLHFVGQQLSGSPAALETQRRHSRYYMAFLQQQEELLYKEAQIVALQSIAAEMENIYIAWRWAAEHDDAGVAQGLAAFFSFCYRRSRFQEGNQALAYAIEHQRRRVSGGEVVLLGRLLVRYGKLVHALGRYDEAQASLEEGIAYLRACHQPSELALGMLALGHLLDDTGNSAQASDLLHEGLALCRRINHVQGIASALDYLCYHYWRVDHFDEAKTCVQESIALYRQLGDLWGLAHALTNMANSARNPAEYQASLLLFDESLALYQKLDNQADMAQTLNSLGYNQMVLGHYTAAQESFRLSLQIERKLGGQLRIARSLNNQGQVAYLLGDHEEALRLSEESLAIRRAAGARREEAFSLYTLGLIAMDMGCADRAEAHWLAALAIFEDLAQSQKIANCLSDLGNLARLRGDFGLADQYLQRSLALCTGRDAAWTQARTLMFMGLLAWDRGEPAEAVASLKHALDIAVSVQETVLALDVLMELVALCTGPSLDPWAFDTLCLVLYHPQSRLSSRQRARQVLLAHGCDPERLDCQNDSHSELGARLAELVDRFELYVERVDTIAAGVPCAAVANSVT